MRNLQKITIFGFGAVIITMAFAFRSGSNDPYYYANGEKLYWQSQYDVYAFRTVDEDSFKMALDSAVVDYVDYRGNQPDKLHFVFFSANSSNWQRLQVIDDIERHNSFSRSFPVVTMFEYTPAEAGLWYVADDQIMLMFKTDSLRQAHLPRLMAEYNLEQVNDPSNLPAGGNYAYILKWDVRDSLVMNSIDLSRTMFERDSAVLWSAEPNLIRGYEPVWLEEDDMSTAAPSLDSEASAATLYVVSQPGGTLNVHVICKQPHYVFRMYDLFGRLLTERRLTAEDTQLDLNIGHLSRGIYFSTLETTGGQPFATVKFLKE